MASRLTYLFFQKREIPGIIAVIAHHKVAAVGDGKRSKVLIDHLIRIVRIKRRAINIYDAVLSLKSLPREVR